MSHHAQQQKGAVLLTALIFLVILTLLSVTAMRSSTLELRMAGNEQEHRRALQSSQSAVNGVLTKGILQVATVGATNCFKFNAATDETKLAGCSTTNTTTLTPGSAAGAYGTDTLVSAQLDQIGACPRTVANSARGQGSLRGSNNGTGFGNCAYFTLNSRYDNIAARGGAAETAEGIIKLIF